jgi:Uncharacterised protein family (UPF0175)
VTRKLCGENTIQCDEHHDQAGASRRNRPTVESKWQDPPRAALESLVVEAYRCELVSAEQVRRLLGFATRFEAEEFLKQHGFYDYTSEDLEHDRKTLRDLRGRD